MTIAKLPNNAKRPPFTRAASLLGGAALILVGVALPVAVGHDEGLSVVVSTAAAEPGKSQGGGKGGGNSGDNPGKGHGKGGKNGGGGASATSDHGGKGWKKKASGRYNKGQGRGGNSEDFGDEDVTLTDDQTEDLIENGWGRGHNYPSGGFDNHGQMISSFVHMAKEGLTDIDGDPITDEYGNPIVVSPSKVTNFLNHHEAYGYVMTPEGLTPMSADTEGASVTAGVESSETPGEDNSSADDGPTSIADILDVNDDGYINREDIVAAYSSGTLESGDVSPTQDGGEEAGGDESETGGEIPPLDN